MVAAQLSAAKFVTVGVVRFGPMIAVRLCSPIEVQHACG